MIQAIPAIGILLGLAGLIDRATPPAPADHNESALAMVGEPYPKVVLPTIEHDRVIDLDSYRGRKILLVHFASW
ncbi:MAG: hypothetical protein V3T70_11675 [Phycisphaerae bacterium]